MVKRYEFDVEMRGMALEEAHLLYKERPDGDWVHHDDYEDLKSELEALREQTRWRDVREELPGDSGRFLCFRPSAAIDEIATRSFYYGYFSSVSEVTHWLPLPQPPKEQE